MSSYVSIPLKEHNKIRRSKDMKAALAAEAEHVAAEANSRAGITDGFVSTSPVAPNPDLTVKGGSAQAHVWAKTGPAIRAENKNAILMGLAANEGMHR